MKTCVVISICDLPALNVCNYFFISSTVPDVVATLATCKIGTSCNYQLRLGEPGSYKSEVGNLHCEKAASQRLRTFLEIQRTSINRTN